jgi:oligopeptide/dipeptide ABC transporter ATP-binding protein
MSEEHFSEVRAERDDLRFHLRELEAAGRIVEEAPVRAIFREPKHPYTRGLLTSLPGPHGTRLRAIEGTVPRLGHIPAGCAFVPRCGDRFEPCGDLPALVAGADGGAPVRCFIHHRVRETAAPAATAAR